MSCSRALEGCPTGLLLATTTTRPAARPAAAASATTSAAAATAPTTAAAASPASVAPRSLSGALGDNRPLDLEGRATVIARRGLIRGPLRSPRSAHSAVIARRGLTPAGLRGRPARPLTVSGGAVVRRSRRWRESLPTALPCRPALRCRARGPCRRAARRRNLVWRVGGGCRTSLRAKLLPAAAIPTQAGWRWCRLPRDGGRSLRRHGLRFARRHLRRCLARSAWSRGGLPPRGTIRLRIESGSIRGRLSRARRGIPTAKPLPA